MKFTKTIVNAVMTWVNKRFKENTPNWSQNDPNADGYIKNRTHYTYEGETVLLPTKRVVEDDQGGLGFATFDGSAFEIKAGKEYQVIFDNTTYSCVGYTDPSLSGGVCLGNFTIVESLAGTSGHEDTGEPFMFMHMAAYGMAGVYTPTVDTHTIKITTVGEKVKKIDQKYLPDLPDMDYVSYEQSQGLTDEQMLMARENIGAGTSNFSGDYRDLTNQPTIYKYVVRYDANQSLTDDDKSKARNNIGAVSKDQVLSVTEEQTLTDRQKELARANIGAGDFDGQFESLVGTPNFMTLDTEQNVPNRKILNFGQDQSVDGTMTGLEINTCMWKDTDGEMNYHTLLGNGAIKMSRTYADGTSQEMMLSPGIIATGMDTIQFQRHHASNGQSVRIINVKDPVDYYDATNKRYVDNAISEIETAIVDTTLTQEGKAADAKATGDAINNVKELIGDTDVATQINNVVNPISDEVNSLSQEIDNLGEVAMEDVVPMSKGGTGAENGAEGLANLFAAGETVLSSYQYGTELPFNPVVGQLYFEEATGTIADIGQDVAKALRARNLLDNSDFTNPVMTAGFNGWHGGTRYPIDRWYDRYGQGGFSKMDEGIVMSVNTGHAYLNQKIANADLLIGKRLTVAIGMFDGSIFCTSGVFTKNGTSMLTTLYTDGQFIEVFDDMVQIVTIDADLGIKWVALYEGEYTVETLPPYVPKGYGVELAECQRYFQKVTGGLGAGVSTTSGTIIVFIPLPVAMRLSTPTVTLSNSLWAYTHTGNAYSLTYGSCVANQNGLRLSCTSNGSTNYPVNVPDINIVISADL